MVIDMNKCYKKSMQHLRLYLKVTKIIPTENQWNTYAKNEKLLSSKSLEYFSHTKFNRMCRKLSKEVSRE